MTNSVIETDYGYDLVWADTEYYNCRIMIFNEPSSQTAIHFHSNIVKSWFVNSGNFRIRWIDTDSGNLYEKELEEGSVFHVPALMPAGIESLTAGGSISQVSNGDPTKDRYQINPINKGV